MNSRQRSKNRRQNAKPAEQITTATSTEHTQATKPKSLQRQERAHFQKTISFAKIFWSVLLGAITIGGGWVLIRPVVHVSPFLRLNAKLPFSERFEVQNNGYFAMHDIHKACRGVSVNSSGPRGGNFETRDNLYLSSETTDLLAAGGSTTTDCPLDRILGLFGLENSVFTTAEIEIIIDFRPSWYPWRKKNSFRFKGQYDSSGSIQWLYK